MIYEYSRNTNKSKVTVSCETVKSRTETASYIVYNLWLFIYLYFIRALCIFIISYYMLVHYRWTRGKVYCVRLYLVVYCTVYVLCTYCLHTSPMTFSCIIIIITFSCNCNFNIRSSFHHIFKALITANYFHILL